MAQVQRLIARGLWVFDNLSGQPIGVELKLSDTRASVVNRHLSDVSIFNGVLWQLRLNASDSHKALAVSSEPQ